MNLLRSLIREALLTEEVYGAQAVVYHGTKADPLKLINALLNDEFTPGVGAGSYYGKGLYTVYDPYKSRTMDGGYGDFVIKLKVNLYGYIIFDQDTARVVYGSSLTPAEQAQKLGCSSATIKALKSTKLNNSEFTSGIAYRAHSDIESEVKGIVFTGKNDGRVVVIYDPSTVIPVAWKRVEGQWRQADRNQKGFKSAVRRSATGEYDEGKYVNDSSILKLIEKLPIDQRIIKNDLDISNTRIVSLPAGLKVVGDLDVSFTRISSLPAGLQVGGSINLYKTRITSLPANLKVNASLNLGDTKISSLPSGLEVKGSINLQGTLVTELPEDLKVGFIFGFKGDRSKVPQHLKDLFFD